MFYRLFDTVIQLAVDRRGVTRVHYAVIACMIVMVIIATLTAFGGNVTAGE